MDQVQELQIRASNSKMDMLTVDEAAIFIKRSKSYLYSLMSSGKIEFYKPTGKNAYFERKTLEEFMRQNKVSKP